MVGQNGELIFMRTPLCHLGVDAQVIEGNFRAGIAEVDRHAALRGIADRAVLQIVVGIAVTAAIERAVDVDLRFKVRKRNGISRILVAQHGERKPRARFLDIHFGNAEIAPGRARRHVARVLIENGRNEIIELRMILLRLYASDRIHRLEAEVPLSDLDDFRPAREGERFAL